MSEKRKPRPLEEQLGAAWSASEASGEPDFEQNLRANTTDGDDDDFGLSTMGHEQGQGAINAQPTVPGHQSFGSIYSTKQGSVAQASTPTGFSSVGGRVSSTSPAARSAVNINSVAKILHLGDSYRALDEAVKRTCIAFLGLDNESGQDLANIVYALLTTDESQMIGLTDLVDLRHEEPVSRAFSLIALPDNRLSTVAHLVTMFSSEYEMQNNLSEKVAFCRDLERGISQIPNKTIQTLEPISELLKEVLDDNVSD